MNEISSNFFWCDSKHIFKSHFFVSGIFVETDIEDCQSVDMRRGRENYEFAKITYLIPLTIC